MLETQFFCFFFITIRDTDKELDRITTEWKDHVPTQWDFGYPSNWLKPLSFDSSVPSQKSPHGHKKIFQRICRSMLKSRSQILVDGSNIWKFLDGYVYKGFGASELRIHDRFTYILSVYRSSEGQIVKNPLEQ